MLVNLSAVQHFGYSTSIFLLFKGLFANSFGKGLKYLIWVKFLYHQRSEGVFMMLQHQHLVAWLLTRVVLWSNIKKNVLQILCLQKLEGMPKISTKVSETTLKTALSSLFLQQPLKFPSFLLDDFTLIFNSFCSTILQFDRCYQMAQGNFKHS